MSWMESLVLACCILSYAVGITEVALLFRWEAAEAVEETSWPIGHRPAKQ
jgi:hypothetical protein